jgi:hypothetical protein
MDSSTSCSVNDAGGVSCGFCQDGQGAPCAPNVQHDYVSQAFGLVSVYNPTSSRLKYALLKLLQDCYSCNNALGHPDQQRHLTPHDIGNGSMQHQPFLFASPQAVHDLDYSIGTSVRPPFPSVGYICALRPLLTCCTLYSLRVSTSR